MKKLISILLGVMFLIIGCQGVDKKQYIAISEILNNPRVYNDRIVSIKGVVVSGENYLVDKQFKIADATGSITVSTEKLLPTVGETMEIKGIVKIVDFPGYGRVTTIKELNQTQ